MKKIKILFVVFTVCLLKTNATAYSINGYKGATNPEMVNTFENTYSFLSKIENGVWAQKKSKKPLSNFKDTASIKVEYLEAGNTKNIFTPLIIIDKKYTGNAKITRFQNSIYQVVVQEFDRGHYTEINAELEYLAKGSSSVTLRITFPIQGRKWIWFSGLENSAVMMENTTYSDTKKIETVLPPDGAFNGIALSDGG
ncbi:MAG TPA: hypothetical protein PKC63_15600, partial [Mariniflexile sp.]|nr:hypothetical protein [Mariniflexile sp.]